MSGDYSSAIRQTELNVKRIEAEIEVLKSDIDMLNKRLEHTKKVALEKRLKSGWDGGLAGTEKKTCYFCDEPIRKKAKICRYCYRAQPDHLMDVAKAKVRIAKLFHDRVRVSNDIAK